MHTALACMIMCSSRLLLQPMYINTHPLFITTTRLVNSNASAGTSRTTAFASRMRRSRRRRTWATATCQTGVVLCVLCGLGLRVSARSQIRPSGGWRLLTRLVVPVLCSLKLAPTLFSPCNPSPRFLPDKAIDLVDKAAAKVDHPAHIYTLLTQL